MDFTQGSKDDCQASRSGSWPSEREVTCVIVSFSAHSPGPWTAAIVELVYAGQTLLLTTINCDTKNKCSRVPETGQNQV